MMSCNCMVEIDKKLEAMGLRIRSVCILKDNRLEAIPEIGLVRLDGKKPRAKEPQNINPTFCPWCGQKYHVPEPESEGTEYLDK